jgi:hypothetical protein
LIEQEIVMDGAMSEKRRNASGRIATGGKNRPDVLPKLYGWRHETILESSAEGCPMHSLHAELRKTHSFALTWKVVAGCRHLCRALKYFS